MKLLKDVFETEFASRQEAADLVKEFKSEIQSLDFSEVRNTGMMYKLLVALAYADVEPFNQLPVLTTSEPGYEFNPYDNYVDDDSWGVAEGGTLGLDEKMPKPQRDALLKFFKMVGIQAYEVAIDRSKCGAIETRIEGAENHIWYLENVGGSGYGPLDPEDLVNVVWTDEDVVDDGFDEYTCWVIHDPKPEAFGFDPKVTGSNWEKITDEDDEDDEFDSDFDFGKDQIREYIWDHKSEFIKPLN